MRKTAYSIGFLCVAFLISAGFYISYHYRDTKYSNGKEEVLEAENTLQTRYHIGIHEGNVIVRLDDGSIYETTDILWESLPLNVQQEIESGYVLESKQELYSFLENYSS